MTYIKGSKGTCSKYNAKKTIIDGITFASKKEALRYSELKLLQKAGIVKNFVCQPVYPLQDGYKRSDGKRIRPINYVGDFFIVYTDGRMELEDVKGVETEVFKIKRKLLEAKYDLVLKIV